MEKFEIHCAICGRIEDNIYGFNAAIKAQEKHEFHNNALHKCTVVEKIEC